MTFARKETFEIRAHQGVGPFNKKFEKNSYIDNGITLFMGLKAKLVL